MVARERRLRSIVATVALGSLALGILGSACQGPGSGTGDRGSTDTNDSSGDLVTGDTGSSGTGDATDSGSTGNDGDAGDSLSDTGSGDDETDEGGDDGPRLDMPSSGCTDSGGGRLCVGDRPVDLLVGDVDGDGCPDVLALASQTNDLTAWYCPGGPSPTKVVVELDGNSAFQGELAHDPVAGHVSVLFREFAPDAGWAGSLAIRDARQPDFTSVQTLFDAQFDGPRRARFLSQNGGELGMLVVREGGELTVYENAMDTYTLVSDDDGFLGSVTALEVVDIDGAAGPEVFYSGLFGTGADTKAGLVVRLLQGLDVGPPVFTELDIPSIGPAAIGNLDGEGPVDAVVLELAAIDFVAGNGDGTFGLPVPQDMTSLQGNILDLTVADLDNDGIDEVVLADCGNNRLVTVRWGQPATAVSVDGCPYSVELADLDQDGDVDAAVLLPDADAVVLLRADGGGNLGPW